MEKDQARNILVRVEVAAKFVASHSEELTKVYYEPGMQDSDSGGRNPDLRMLDDAIMALAKAHLSLMNFLADTPTGAKIRRLAYDITDMGEVKKFVEGASNAVVAKIETGGI